MRWIDRYREWRANRARRRREAREVAAWRRGGCPPPPPHSVKQQIVAEHGRRHGIQILVESGTYLGDMVHACRDRFARIISIELDPKLHRDARARFRRDRHVEFHQGDSGKLLPRLIAAIAEPCVFWLDGHYSAGVTAKGESNTPILQELSAILDHPVDGHVILIDDARCFSGEADYPTVDAVRELVASRKRHCRFELEHDIMRILPPSEGRKR